MLTIFWTLFSIVDRVNALPKHSGKAFIQARRGHMAWRNMDGAKARKHMDSFFVYSGDQEQSGVECPAETQAHTHAETYVETCCHSPVRRFQNLDLFISMAQELIIQLSQVTYQAFLYAQSILEAPVQIALNHIFNNIKWFQKMIQILRTNRHVKFARDLCITGIAQILIVVGCETIGERIVLFRQVLQTLIEARWPRQRSYKHELRCWCHVQIWGPKWQLLLRTIKFGLKLPRVFLAIACTGTNFSYFLESWFIWKFDLDQDGFLNSVEFENFVCWIHQKEIERDMTPKIKRAFYKELAKQLFIVDDQDHNGKISRRECWVLCRRAFCDVARENIFYCKKMIVNQFGSQWMGWFDFGNRHDQESEHTSSKQQQKRSCQGSLKVQRREREKDSARGGERDRESGEVARKKERESERL